MGDQIFKMKKNIIIISVIIIVLLIAGTCFTIFGGEDNVFNILGSNTEQLEISCSTDNECYDKVLDMAFPKAELDTQLQEFNLICKDSLCEVSK